MSSGGRLTGHLSPEIARMLKQLAIDSGRSESSLVAEAVVEYLKLHMNNQVPVMDKSIAQPSVNDIETAWGVRELYDIPVWAARDTHNLGLFTPPPGIDELLIFIDTDPPKLNKQGQQVGLAGQRHGEILLNRMTEAGVKARIMEIPLSQRRLVAQEIGGTMHKMDWLDVANHKNRNSRKSWNQAAAY